jgi:putative ABC transport system permease protein
MSEGHQNIRGWSWKMALRDGRKNRGRLLLFMSSIVLGIAALVSINSFGENLKDQINGEAKELLGADLEVESRQPIPDEVYSYFDSLEMKMIREVNFASMVLFPKSGGTRLVNVRAIEDGFPFYGSLETEPARQDKTVGGENVALVDQTLMLQFDAQAGDSVKVGKNIYKIDGEVLSVPGQSGIASTVAPPVFVKLSSLEGSGLMQKGSRIEYRLYIKYPDEFDPARFETEIEPRLEANKNLRFDDVEERKEEVGDTYSDLTGFLNLTAFIALLLGCLGVASSVHIYIKEKVTSVAILRCLGAGGGQSMRIFLIQVALMGFVGGTIGAALGVVVQYFLPSLFQGFLPFEVDLAISWSSVIQGILLGLITSVLFALTPLLAIRKISPLRALRTSVGDGDQGREKYFVYGGIVLFIYVFAFLQLGEWFSAMIFTAGLFVAFAVLTLIARAIMYLVKRYFPGKSSFVFRQGLANLFRPNNQTLILVVTIGLGTALITTLLMTQSVLLDKVKFSAAPEGRPNMVLFDIQDDQVEEVTSLTREQGLPVKQVVPIVTMKIHSLKGREAAAIREDSTSTIPNWVLGREYRVTYRDSLSESETIVDGEYRGRVENPGDSIFISIEDERAKDMQLEIGDKISFNVQGAIIETYVGSIRNIDWQRVQTNFFVLFPEGVLEKAPKFHVLMTRFDSPEESAEYQKAVVSEFPNISIIDLELILETVDAVISKVSFVIRFMAFFSILTGLIVLIGSVLISRLQRMKESVLLRTLGASRKQIFRINAVEYLMLGTLAGFTGLLIALSVGWALAAFVFETTFLPPLVPLLITWVAIIAFTMLIGLSNIRKVTNNPPLKVLRQEE